MRDQKCIQNINQETGRWKDNIKVDLTIIRCKAVGWIELAEGMVNWWAL
jgi:hypothetical protein